MEAPRPETVGGLDESLTRPRWGKGARPMMTQRQYVKVNNGLHCPECGSPHLDGGPVEIEAGEAWQMIGCLDCQGTWRDVYTLTRFEGFREWTDPRKTTTAPRIKIRLT